MSKKKEEIQGTNKRIETRPKKEKEIKGNEGKRTLLKTVILRSENR